MKFAKNIRGRNILSDFGGDTSCLRDNFSVAVELEGDLLEIGVEYFHFCIRLGLYLGEMFN